MRVFEVENEGPAIIALGIFKAVPTFLTRLSRMKLFEIKIKSVSNHFKQKNHPQLAPIPSSSISDEKVEF